MSDNSSVTDIVKILLSSAEDKLKNEANPAAKPYLEGYIDACKLMLEYIDKK